MRYWNTLYTSEIGMGPVTTSTSISNHVSWSPSTTPISLPILSSTSLTSPSGTIVSPHSFGSQFGASSVSFGSVGGGNSGSVGMGRWM